MSILKQISPASMHVEISKLHDTVENKPYLKRYLDKRGIALELVDHYRNLVQLHDIYVVFAERMTTLNWTFKFPPHLTFLIDRAHVIRQDIYFLQAYVKTSACHEKMAATNAYIKELRAIPRGEAGDYQFLAHFLVAILGDLNGGALALSGRVQAMYERHHIAQPSSGVAMYQFPDKTLVNFETFLREKIPFASAAHLADSAVEQKYVDMGQHIIAAFNHHIKIVEQLETTRHAANASLSHTGLFSKRNIVIGLGVVGTVATASIVAAMRK